MVQIRSSREGRARGGFWLWSGIVAACLCMSGANAHALEVEFDDTSEPAPQKFQDVWPGGEFGPEVDRGAASLDGAVIGLAVTPADQAATTPPQFYITSDFQELADGRLLPGEIAVTLDEPADLVALDIGNGNSFAASFTLTALDGAVVVDTDTVTLAGFGAAGFVGELEAGASSITAFTVTSNQPAGTKLFSIDTVEVRLLPEPGSSLVVVVAMGALAIRDGRKGWRRRQGPMRNARPQSCPCSSSS